MIPTKQTKKDFWNVFFDWLVNYESVDYDLIRCPKHENAGISLKLDFEHQECTCLQCGYFATLKSLESLLVSAKKSSIKEYQKEAAKLKRVYTKKDT